MTDVSMVPAMFALLGTGFQTLWNGSTAEQREQMKAGFERWNRKQGLDEQAWQTIMAKLAAIEFRYSNFADPAEGQKPWLSDEEFKELFELAYGTSWQLDEGLALSLESVLYPIRMLRHERHYDSSGITPIRGEQAVTRQTMISKYIVSTRFRIRWFRRALAGRWNDEIELEKRYVENLVYVRLWELLRNKCPRIGERIRDRVNEDAYHDDGWVGIIRQERKELSNAVETYLDEHPFDNGEDIHRFCHFAEENKMLEVNESLVARGGAE